MSYPSPQLLTNMFTSWMSGMSGQTSSRAWGVKIQIAVASCRSYRWRIFVKNLWHCIQVTCRVSCPFGIHLRSLQRWPTSHIAEHVDQSSHGPKWCWQITGQGTWYGKEDLTKNIKEDYEWMLKNMCCETEKQQFCLFWQTICWFRLGSLKLSFHSDYHNLFYITALTSSSSGNSVRFELKIYKNTLSASKGTVREHGTDSTKGGHPSPRGPGACVILPCTFDAMTQVNDPGNSVLKSVLNLYITRNHVDLLVISGHPIYQSLICWVPSEVHRAEQKAKQWCPSKIYIQIGDEKTYLEK